MKTIQEKWVPGTGTSGSRAIKAWNGSCSILEGFFLRWAVKTVNSSRGYRLEVSMVVLYLWLIRSCTAASSTSFTHSIQHDASILILCKFCLLYPKDYGTCNPIIAIHWATGLYMLIVWIEYMCTLVYGDVSLNSPTLLSQWQPLCLYP